MKKVLLALLAVLLVASAAFADYKVTLKWDPNSEPDLAGYKVYYVIVDPSEPGAPPYVGQGAFGGDSPITLQIIDSNGENYVSNADPEYTIVFPETVFESEKRVAFVLTAYDSEIPPLESNFSNQVSVVLPRGAYEGKAPLPPNGLVPSEVERILKIVMIERVITRFNSN